MAQRNSASCSGEPVFVHGDLHGYNQLWDQRRLRLRLVADFETSGAAEAEYDLRVIPLSARASTSSSPPPPTTPVAQASTSISIGSWPGTYAPPSATRCGERPAHPRHACPTPTDRWHHHLT